MNEINAARMPVVTIKDGEVFADSRDVAEYFDRNHFDVLRAIRNLQCSDDFRQRNFASFKINDLTGEATSHVEMTKDGFTFLAMGFTGAKAGGFKERYIGAFNAMEAEVRRQAAAQNVDLNDPGQLRSLLLNYSEKAEALQKQVDALEPTKQALERIAEADGSLCVTDAAKALQMRPKDLFGYLRQNHWVYRRPGTTHDVGYQSKVSAGLLEHKVTTVTRTDGSEKITEQVRVTSKGLTKLAEIIQPGA